MTTATITSSICTIHPVSPTLTDRALLRMSRAVESLALARMRRRASAAARTADAAIEARRTALALGATGILPR